MFPSKYEEFPRPVSNTIISEKNIFFEFVFAFLKCEWNWKYFQKKDENPSLIISETIDSERRGYLKV